MKEFDLGRIKQSLTEMGIPYKEGATPENLAVLIRTYGYEAAPILADITNVDTVDAELGVIVRNAKYDVDDGIYIFTVLHSGQAGFIVVEPGTISRAPLVRNVVNNVANAITGIDIPPLMPFDMVEITAHVLANTVMKMVMESCRVPEEYEQVFLHLYMPKFLLNVGYYFAGATKEDGSPMIHEEIVNMEPMMVWNSIQKGAGTNESNDRGDAAGEGTGAGEGKGTEKAEGEKGTETEEKEETPLS